MSVKHAIGRGLELGRSLIQLGLLKPGGRAAVKLRAERLRGAAAPRSVPCSGAHRYRYYRCSVRGLAAQLQAAGFRRLGGGSVRNRAVFLAFGLGLGLIEQQEEDRKSNATCQEIQAVFRKKRFQAPIQPLNVSGYKLDDYLFGNQIGKGSNAAVYEAAARFAPLHPLDHKKTPPEVLKDDEEKHVNFISCCSLRNFPLAIKMLWNFGAGSSSEAILKSMSQELVPAAPLAVKQEIEQISLDGFGPRQIRVESAMLRAYNSGTRAAPYESVKVADIGDVNVNLFDLKDTCKRIREAYRKIVATGCIPLTMGGDHTIAYPILQAVAEKYGPVGLVHVDAHADVSDVILGEKIGHGTPFRRCVEEGLLDCHRVVQIGLRGTGYSADAYEWSRSQGFRVVQAEDCWFKSLAPLMSEVRAQMGSGPVYLSFDIDALDPGFAPGTGTPEIAGLTPIQGVEIIRGCRGMNLVGCDLVEVSPAYDTTGNTALTGANLLFEMLCVLPMVKYY